MGREGEEGTRRRREKQEERGEPRGARGRMQGKKEERKEVSLWIFIGAKPIHRRLHKREEGGGENDSPFHSTASAGSSQGSKFEVFSLPDQAASS